MELEGLKRGMAFMKQQHVKVASLTTNRHSSIKKYTRTEQPDIKHWFDVWRIAEG